MRYMPIALVGALLLLGTSAATAQQKPSAAEDVMAAQYAAKSRSTAMQADEAERIREEYLKNIGKKLEKPASTSGSGSGK